MDKKCPICNNNLKREHRISYIDYHCFPSKKDHHYAERIVNDKISKLKIRISPKDQKLFFKTHYDDNYSEIWTKENDTENRIKINNSIKLDFSDLSKLETKIRMYLLLS